MSNDSLRLETLTAKIQTTINYDAYLHSLVCAPVERRDDLQALQRRRLKVVISTENDEALSDLQSSIDRFLTTKIFEYIRAVKKMKVKTRQTALATYTVQARDSVFIKLGVTPGGGIIGILLKSKPGGNSDNDMMSIIESIKETSKPDI